MKHTQCRTQPTAQGATRISSNSTEDEAGACPNTLQEEEDPLTQVLADISERLQTAQHEHRSCAGSDFMVSFRSQYSGVDVWESDRVIASAKKGSPTMFCSVYSLNRLQSCCYSRYTESGATKLDREWCRRMQYMYNTRVSQREIKYCFTDADVSGYQPDTEWRSFVSSVPASGQVVDRARALEELRPQPPSLETLTRARWPAAERNKGVLPKCFRVRPQKCSP